MHVPVHLLWVVLWHTYLWLFSHDEVASRPAIRSIETHIAPPGSPFPQGGLWSSPVAWMALNEPIQRKFVPSASRDNPTQRNSFAAKFRSVMQKSLFTSRVVAKWPPRSRQPLSACHHVDVSLIAIVSGERLVHLVQVAHCPMQWKRVEAKTHHSQALQRRTLVKQLLPLTLRISWSQINVFFLGFVSVRL